MALYSYFLHLYLLHWSPLDLLPLLSTSTPSTYYLSLPTLLPPSLHHSTSPLHLPPCHHIFNNKNSFSIFADKLLIVDMDMTSQPAR